MSKPAMFVGGPWNGKSEMVNHGAKYVEMVEQYPHSHGVTKHRYDYLTTSLDGIDVYVLSHTMDYNGYYSSNPYGKYNGYGGSYADEFYKNSSYSKWVKEPIKPSISKPIEPDPVSPNEAWTIIGHTSMHSGEKLPEPGPKLPELKAKGIIWDPQSITTTPAKPLDDWEVELLNAEHGTAKEVREPKEDLSLLDDLDDPIDEDDPEYVQEQADKAAAALKKAEEKATLKHINIGAMYGMGAAKIQQSLKGVSADMSYVDEVLSWKHVIEGDDGDMFF